eukprot:XP_020397284.1 skin secretory protein xP2-like [Zea mays]
MEEWSCAGRGAGFLRDVHGRGIRPWRAPGRGGELSHGKRREGEVDAAAVFGLKNWAQGTRTPWTGKCTGLGAMVEGAQIWAPSMGSGAHHLEQWQGASMEEQDTGLGGQHAWESSQRHGRSAAALLELGKRQRRGEKAAAKGRAGASACSQGASAPARMKQREEELPPCLEGGALERKSGRWEVEAPWLLACSLAVPPWPPRRLGPRARRAALSPAPGEPRRHPASARPAPPASPAPAPPLAAAPCAPGEPSPAPTPREPPSPEPCPLPRARPRPGEPLRARPRPSEPLPLGPCPGGRALPARPGGRTRPGRARAPASPAPAAASRAPCLAPSAMSLPAPVSRRLASRAPAQFACPRHA